MMLWYSVPEERLRVCSVGNSVGKTVTGIRIALAILLGAPLVAYPAGLGRLTVNSALGQPLNAEIEIVSLQTEEEDALTARLASHEAFRQAGIELSPALVGLQFAIDKRGNRPLIRLTTSQPVNEPFLDVLIELQWATGRLVREYTFLLDPPEYRGPRPLAATPAVTPAAKPVPAPAPAKPEPRAEARPIAAAPVAVGARQEEVKKGDTLGAIVRKHKPEGVTFNQMLIALYRANQDAFINENLNLVRVGRILNVPDREAIATINVAQANQLVQSQMADFAEYKRKLGAAVAAAPAAPGREREVSGRIAAGSEAPAPVDQKDQLKLAKANPEKPGTPSSRAAREDDQVARERSLKESQARVGDLEKNVTDLQKLLELKNQQLAELEKKATVKPAAPAIAPAPAPAAAPATKPAPEAAKPATEAPQPTPEAPREAVTPAPKVAAQASKVKPKAAPVKAPAPEKSFVEEFVEDPISIGGLSAVVLLLALYGAWAWRRKKAADTTQFQDSVLSTAHAPDATSGFDSAAAKDVTDTLQPLAAASSTVSVSGGSVAVAQSDEVDPIAEADVYMAYGRDAQAEEILKEALVKDPNRIVVHAKLLEIYANRKDSKSFEQVALKVKGLADGASPEWTKAMALGHSIDPGNGLYGSGGAAEVVPVTLAASAVVAPMLDFDIGGADAPAEVAEAKSDLVELDFDIGSPAPKSDVAAGDPLIIDSKEAQDSSGGGIDFDLGDGDKPAVTVKTADLAATVAIDFDLSLDLDDAKAKKPADAPLDLGGLSFDLGPPVGVVSPGGADPKWQEVATKLDLAKAYQEMGDKEGARELLNEVTKEGDAAQQGQAQQMLSNLG